MKPIKWVLPITLTTSALWKKREWSSLKISVLITLNLKNAIGENATVYVPIPPKNQGTGKVTMQLQGRFCELEAVNAGEEMLKTGSQVLVSDVVGDTLVVEEC